VEQEQLAKIDTLRERTDLSYAEAKRLLTETNWDVVEALVLAEEENKDSTSAWMVKGSELLEAIRHIVRRGNASRIRVMQGEKVILDVPITAGVVAAIIAPWATGLGVAACVLSRCTMEVDWASKERAVTGDLK